MFKTKKYLNNRKVAEAVNRSLSGSDDSIDKRGQREILAQIEVWKAQEYDLYFKFYKLRSWGKRSAESRRQLIQRFRNSVDPLFYLSSFQTLSRKSPVSSQPPGIFPFPDNVFLK